MRKSAVLVNFARGPIVDGEAVIEALDSGSLRGYVCDFPTPELNKRPNVVTLPHLGASTNEAEENCAYMAAEELKAYLEDGTITNSVNFPEAELARRCWHPRGWLLPTAMCPTWSAKSPPCWPRPGSTSPIC